MPRMRVLAHSPLLALHDDIDAHHRATPHASVATLMQHTSAQARSTLAVLENLDDTLLRFRLVTCLAIAPTTPTLVIFSHSAPAITTTNYTDGQVIVVPVHMPGFVHIARTRMLPAHEQQRRQAILDHPHLPACVALAQHHTRINAALVAHQLGIATAAATALLKQFTPVFVATPDAPKSYVYDDIAARAIRGYQHEATLTTATTDPRQHLPEVVRRYCNHQGIINQLPVRYSDRTQVLRYLAQQLPLTPLSEPEINAAILRHVAFADYATARRDMVDLGLVVRTANGSVYQRVYDISN